MFELKHITLPHDGVIPGGGRQGRKKQVIHIGTKIWCIVYGMKFYWVGYLDEKQAHSVMQELHRVTLPRTRRRIELPTLIAWNFHSAIPTRIAQPKETLR